MLRDLKITFRRIVKNRLTAFVNVTGLTIGMFVSFALINFYLQEQSYDRYHSKADRIYKAASRVNFNKGAAEQFSITFGTLGESLELNVSDVEKTARLYYSGLIEVDLENKRFNDIKTLRLDYSFFDLFDFQGIGSDNFRSPNDAILSSETADKLFDGDALGKQISVQNKTYTITGVAEIPKNTVFKFDLVLPVVSMPYYDEMKKGGLEFETYALLKDGANHTATTGAMAEHYNALMKAKWSNYEPSNYFLPLKEVYLNDMGLRNRLGNGDRGQLLIILTISLVVMALALINYINLQIASNHRRLMEMRLKKILGAGKKILVKQGILESLLVLIVSSFLAIILLDLFYASALSGLFGKEALSIRDWKHIDWLLFGLTILMLGTITGAVPSLKLFNKSGTNQQTLGDKRLGKMTIGLVVFQFLVTASLLTTILFVNKQMDFLRNQPKGYSAEQVVMINNLSDIHRERYDLIRSQLLQNSGILNVAGAQSAPGSGASGQFAHRNDKSAEEGIEIAHIRTLEGYAGTLELKFLQGGDFSITDPEGENQFIINQSAAQLLFKEDESIIGQVINMSGRIGKIVGVVEDFHYLSFKHGISPLAINIEEPFKLTLMVKLETENIQAGLNQIEQSLAAIDPLYVFDYQFLNDQFDRMYRSEIRTGKIITYSTIVAFSISILGLLALSLFVINAKLKEIAIRKTLGGSHTHIFLKLSSQLITWIVAGNLLAIPVAYYVSMNWVQDFIYQISLGHIIWMSGISTVITLVVGLLIILRKLHATITMNPVEFLKYE